MKRQSFLGFSPPVILANPAKNTIPSPLFTLVISHGYLYAIEKFNVERRDKIFIKQRLVFLTAAIKVVDSSS